MRKITVNYMNLKCSLNVETVVTCENAVCFDELY